MNHLFKNSVLCFDFVNFLIITSMLLSLSSVAQDSLSDHDNVTASQTASNKKDIHKYKDVLFIEYESDQKNIALEVKNILNIRLTRFNIFTRIRPITDMSVSIPNMNYLWHATIRTISDKYYIVTVDGDKNNKIQEVRTVEKEKSTAETAWTLALVIEYTIATYHKKDNLPALGAGLALIEPDVIAGTKDKPVQVKIKYPHFKGAGLSLQLSGIWSIDQIIAGPNVVIKGLFSKKTVALFGIGWEGNTHFNESNISGTMSLVPINMLLGSLFVNSKYFDLAGWTGFSMGFAIYKTSDGHSSRTDMTFMPELHLSLEIVAKIVKPWAISIAGGVRIPLVRDILENNGAEVYSQVWIIPFISIGPQIYF